MNCPHCQEGLTKDIYKEIEVDKCPKCEGMWFDYKEVDQIEDTVFDDDESKNSMVTHIKPCNLKCPVCSEAMEKFNYRWEELEMETCPKKHGFWLDKKENDKVIELMEKYKVGFENKIAAENDWANYLKRLQSPGFFSKLKDLFRL